MTDLAMTDLAILPFMDAFPAPSLEAWRGAVEKVLKGGDFEKKLVGRTGDGIRVEPLYRAATGAARSLRAEPGRWGVTARLDHPVPVEANALALAELEGGADGLTIAFSGAPAARGHGLVASDVADLALALDGVMLDLIRLRFDPGPGGRIDALMVAALVERRKLDPAGLSIAFGLDAIGTLATHGRFSAPWPEVARRIAETVTGLFGRGFRGPFLLGDGRPWHEAGATEARELGAALATMVAYLRVLEAGGVPLDQARDTVAMTLVADAEQFLTVAKFRAARLLWDRVQQACGLAPKPLALHAETSWRMQTRRDPWVNLLRGTIAAFSAGIGGADSITVLPLTAALGLPDAFARRVARNTQHVLLEEANLWRVADPAAGAGGFEALTEALCEAAWSEFQTIEREARDGQPGIVAALASGHIQQGLARERAARERAIATRRQAITGTSEYPNLAEAPVGVLAVAPAARREPAPGADPGGATDPAVLIARLMQGGTREAIASAPVAGFSVERLPSVRAAEPFEALRDAAEAFAAGSGTAPAVFLAVLGPVSAFTPHATFARNLFEAGGLAAPVPEGFAAAGGGTDLAALETAFRASGARLACLCGSDEGYAGEAVPASAVLRSAGATVWLAGRPGEQEAAWAVAGIAAFVFAGCDAVAVLRDAQAVALMGLAR